MAITQTLPPIPATPGLPDRVPGSKLPEVLTRNSQLATLVGEFNRLRAQYRDRAQVHRDIANPGALNAAVKADDLAHASAVRDGLDDPGPVNVNAWRESEETARRAVAGSRDAIKLTWADLVAVLADPEVGGQLAADAAAGREEARARMLGAIEALRAAMDALDTADHEATHAEAAHLYAVAQGNNGQRPDGMTARWSNGAKGSGRVVMINARPEPPENVLAMLAQYRQTPHQG